VVGHHRPHHGGCPLRAQIQRDVRARVGSLPGVTHVTLDWTEMTQEEKSSAMAKARWNVAQRPEDTALAPTTKVVLVGLRQGRASASRRSRSTWRRPAGRPV
jgi:ATP-binding protein involved in chromosome partitioning